MPPILLGLPTVSKADVDDMVVEVEPSHYYRRGVGVGMEQRRVIGFFHAE